SGSLTSTNGAGVYYGCTANNNPFYRSGDYGYGANSGIYTLGQGATEADDDPTFGFRCAL
ncbi:MAG: hypothetical protein KC653_02430, partial [Candidatus Andersenbacteria bacterium]|nr:hypothetical protein [Candidatus Andersenbacteria bacterium]